MAAAKTEPLIDSDKQYTVVMAETVPWGPVILRKGTVILLGSVLKQILGQSPNAIASYLVLS